MFTSMFPILSSPAPARLRQFYVEALDATETYRFPADGEPAFVSLDIAGGHLGIGPDAAAPAAGAPQRCALWFYAVDCDQAFHQLRAAGAQVVTEPSDTDWGERVAQVLDLDGNLLHIGQAAPAGPG